MLYFDWITSFIFIFVIFDIHRVLHNKCFRYISPEFVAVDLRKILYSWIILPTRWSNYLKLSWYRVYLTEQLAKQLNRTKKLSRLHFAFTRPSTIRLVLLNFCQNRVYTKNRNCWMFSITKRSDFSKFVISLLGLSPTQHLDLSVPQFEDMRPVWNVYYCSLLTILEGSCLPINTNNTLKSCIDFMPTPYL